MDGWKEKRIITFSFYNNNNKRINNINVVGKKSLVWQVESQGFAGRDQLKSTKSTIG